MKKLVFRLVVVGVLAGCTAKSEPVATPTVHPSREFDDRTEKYLNLLNQTPTGASLVRFVRINDDLSEVNILWIDFPEESEADGEALKRDEDKAVSITLAANRLADPTNVQPNNVDMAYGAIVLGHEIAHIVLADFYSQPNYTIELQESLAELVEAKIATELFVLLEGQSTSYYQMLQYYDNIPDEPWTVAERIEAMGIELLDMDLAKRILWLPEPKLQPTPTPESEFLESLLAMSLKH